MLVKVGKGNFLLKESLIWEYAYYHMLKHPPSPVNWQVFKSSQYMLVLWVLPPKKEQSAAAFEGEPLKEMKKQLLLGRHRFQSIYLSIYVCIYVSIYVSICLSSACPSVCLSERYIPWKTNSAA